MARDPSKTLNERRKDAAQAAMYKQRNAGKGDSKSYRRKASKAPEDSGWYESTASQAVREKVWKDGAKGSLEAAPAPPQHLRHSLR